MTSQSRVQSVQPGEVVWQPDAERIASSRLAAFHRWVAGRTDAAGPAPTGPDDAASAYRALYEWSVGDLEGFWRSVVDYFDVRFGVPPRAVLGSEAMPGAEWFPGATVNWAEHALRPALDARRAAEPALVCCDEGLRMREVSWAELRRQVGALARTLSGMGVRAGDRVVGYLPNVPEAIVAVLATASLGAVWSSCAPDFGARGVLDRFQQIEPVALITVDGVRYAGKVRDRAAVVAELREGLPTLRGVVHVPLLGSEPPAGAVGWNEAVAGDAEPEFHQVPFDHPLWVLYSSGTTGLPKAIVQSQGGILVEHVKQAGLHVELGEGERFFWYTSTGWMMWNFLTAGLLVGATVVLYDGAATWPDVGAAWRVAEASGATVFGTSASYLMACRKAGLRPGRDLDLSRVRCVATTGSPLPPDGFRWVYEAVADDLWLASVSGGTDVCSCFVGGVPTLPVRVGELQARCLGVAAESWDEDGRPLVDEVGELVITRPLPSMPVRLWGDPEGARYRDSYFGVYPGVWRHGDWVTVTAGGGVVIHGRSDSTLNRSGVRMGSSDIYEAVERLKEIRESLVIGVEQPDGGYWMPLFVQLADGATLDEALRRKVRATIREQVSPRHVPDEIIEVRGIPHTLTGKRIEVPVKRLMQGVPLERAANLGSVDDPELLRDFQRMAAERRGVS